MEEKINNQKIFSYVPPLVAKFILDNDLKDSDVFFKNNENINIKKNKISKDSLDKYNSNNKDKIKKKFNIKSYKTLDSEFIKPNIFPITNTLPNSLIMIIQLKGFEKLISSLIIKDQENKKEKLFSEYLAIEISRLLLKISGILSENGGEVVKYNDFEFTIIWNFSDAPQNKLLKYQKFYAKYAIISAIEILKKFDDKEILGTKIEICIGISIGESSINFFGGERKRSEFLILGEAIEQAELCIDKCVGHEIIISKEINYLFRGGQEIMTRDIGTELEKKHLFSIIEFDENNLKNFEGYDGMKLNNNNIFMNKSVYENLSKKVYILSSILPQGLIKYLDVGEEQNLKEICLLTILTIQISMSIELIDDLTQIQNIIFDIQKATYMTFGSLLYISKTYSGLIIRCCWGIDPGNFIDNTARAVCTTMLIGMLTNHYEIKIGMGISTGACFTGLINIQGNRQMFTLMGKKVSFSRTLADEALQKIINGDSKYLIYCDKLTMKHSQKWFRYAFISRINVYFDNEKDLFFKSKDDFFTRKSKNWNKKNEIEMNNKIKNFKNKAKKSKKKNLKNKSIDMKNTNTENEIYKKYEMEQKKNKLIQEVFSPIENEEYFMPNYHDPFPFIRTHLYNSFNPMDKLVTFNVLNKINQKQHTMTPQSLRKEQMKEKDMKKLKKSQTIFGHSEKINNFINLMNLVIEQNKKQFIVIRGPSGVGKSLFLRKVLNNFIGLNEKLSKNYFIGDEFLFCNLINPFTSTLPYNTISFILRKIYLNILTIKKFKLLKERTENLLLDEEDYKHINYILSLGKNDVDIKDEINSLNMGNKKINSLLKKKEEEKKNEEVKGAKILKRKIYSVMTGLEGPYNYKNQIKLNIFFYELIKLYREHLNKKNIDSEFNCPLILVIDDAQRSNNFSYDFIQYLFIQDERILNPFIVILIQQTPLNFNYNSYGTNKIMDEFISSSIEYTNKPNEESIICFDIKPINDKNILKKLIIYYFKDLVLNNYKTNLETVDEQILDFLLIKSFNGIPLLIIALFKSLLKSDKFIQVLSGEFIITSELMDDNKILDWSDILLPYIYEKYASMKINSLLNFKETLILKYACILGTIFDLQTLDKLNPLKNIIKIKDLEKVMLKLYNENIIEIFSSYENKSQKIENITCKICFPLLREVFHQKFPMEFRSNLHMKAANILSTQKKANYFSTENDILILKRHLLYSEMNVINETETKEIKTVKDILQNKKMLNYSNLKILLIKELYSKFCYEISGNILEGNLELFFKSKWLRISYFINRRAKILFNQRDEKQNKLINILELSIQEIYKNQILKNFDVNKFKCLNVLEISVSANSSPFLKNYKKIYYLRSEQREEICKLDIAINFLKVKVNYDKYVNIYGISKFPLYKYKWFIKKKANKYYANFEQRQIHKRKSVNNYDISNTDKLINVSEKIYKPFTIIITSTISLFLSIIQEKIDKKFKEDKENYIKKSIDIINKYNTNISDIFLTTPKHISKRINKYFKDLEQKGILENKEEKKDIPSIPIDKIKTVSFNESSNEYTSNTLRSNKSSKNHSHKSNLKKYSKFINQNQSKNSSDKNYIKNNKSSSSSNSKKKININLIPKPKTSKTLLKNMLNEDMPKKFESVKVKKRSDDLELDEELSFSDFDLTIDENIDSLRFFPNTTENFGSKKNSNNDKNNWNYLNITEDSSFPISSKDIISNDKEKINYFSNNNKNKSRNIKYPKANTNKIFLFEDKNALPGDFVPKSIDSIDKKHVKYIKSETISKRKKDNKYIFDFDISSIINNDVINKNKNELKYKTLYDDPKYVYINNNKNIKKVHKSNLFVNLKSKNYKK